MSLSCLWHLFTKAYTVINAPDICPADVLIILYKGIDATGPVKKSVHAIYEKPRTCEVKCFSLCNFTHGEFSNLLTCHSFEIKHLDKFAKSLFVFLFLFFCLFS